MFVAGTTWFAVTGVSESARVPVPEAGSVTILTFDNVSPSASEKLNSLAANVRAVSSFVVTVPSDAKGRVFGAGVTAAVAALVSVSGLLASSVKLTVTLIVVPWSAATSV